MYPNVDNLDAAKRKIAAHAKAARKLYAAADAARGTPQEVPLVTRANGHSAETQMLELQWVLTAADLRFLANCAA